jgi:hypothetical protein
MQIISQRWKEYHSSDNLTPISDGGFTKLMQRQYTMYVGFVTDEMSLGQHLGSSDHHTLLSHKHLLFLSEFRDEPNQKNGTFESLCGRPKWFKIKSFIVKFVPLYFLEHLKSRQI